MLCSDDDLCSISTVSLQEKYVQITCFQNLNWHILGLKYDSIANKLYAVFCETNDTKELMIFRVDKHE